MDKKFDLKRFAGFIMCLGAAVMAFKTEMESQQKDRQIEDMETRLAKLEKQVKEC